MDKCALKGATSRTVGLYTVLTFAASGDPCKLIIYQLLSNKMPAHA